MKAIILAAGEAKRLRPLTEHTPKCMLRVGPKTIIDYQVENLLANGITELVFVVGFEADKLMRHLRSTHPTATFTFIRSKDYQKTYPAHGLWLAREHLVETVLYLNADVIFDSDILRQVIKDRRHSVTAVQRSLWDEEEVNVIVNDEMRIVEMGKHIAKSLSYGEFIGVTKIGKEFGAALITVLEEFVEKEELKKFAADAINLSIQRGEIMYALDVSELEAIEVDTKEDLAAAEKKIARMLECHT